MSEEFLIQYGERLDAASRKEKIEQNGFGETFSDHMITVEWSMEKGWHNSMLKPLENLVLHPSAQVFHYGQAIFEGLKAFRNEQQEISIFRPFDNARRFQKSCQRMAMPELPESTFVKALELLAQTDKEWIAQEPGAALYFRPFMIATQSTLGLHGRSSRFLFVVIATPIKGNYFKSENGTISAYVSDKYSRACSGGTGSAKCVGNYAGTILAQEEAAKEGCGQVIWLDAKENRWVEEMGTSNIFFVVGNQLLTPALTDTILAGITRDTIIKLARDCSYDVKEQAIDIDEICRFIKDGTLVEAFSSGTTASITPITSIKRGSEEFLISGGRAGKIAKLLKEQLIGVQAGHLEDKFGWLHRI